MQDPPFSIRGFPVPKGVLRPLDHFHSTGEGLPFAAFWLFVYFADILSSLKVEVPAPSTVPPSVLVRRSYSTSPLLGLSADSPLPVGTEFNIA